MKQRLAAWRPEAALEQAVTGCIAKDCVLQRVRQTLKPVVQACSLSTWPRLSLGTESARCKQGRGRMRLLPRMARRLWPLHPKLALGAQGLLCVPPLSVSKSCGLRRGRCQTYASPPLRLGPTATAAAPAAEVLVAAEAQALSLHLGG